MSVTLSKGKPVEGAHFMTWDGWLPCYEAYEVNGSPDGLRLHLTFWSARGWAVTEVTTGGALYLRSASIDDRENLKDTLVHVSARLSEEGATEKVAELLAANQPKTPNPFLLKERAERAALKTEAELIDELRKAVTSVSLELLARHLCITEGYLHAIVAGRRGLSPVVVKAMGYVAETTYRKKEAAP